MNNLNKAELKELKLIESLQEALYDDLENLSKQYSRSGLIDDSIIRGWLEAPEKCPSSSIQEKIREVNRLDCRFEELNSRSGKFIIGSFDPQAQELS